MCILHAGQIEVLFPVRPFFLQWSWAIANFNPAHRIIRAHPSLLHVSQILALGDGALAESLLLDCLQQISLSIRFHAGSH